MIEILLKIVEKQVERYKEDSPLSWHQAQKISECAEEGLKEMSKIWTMALIAVLMTVNCVSAGMVNLAYDDGIVDDGVWIDEQRGHAVVFTAPIDNWSLSQVAILGKILPESAVSIKLK